MRPSSEQLDGAALAYCLSDIVVAKQRPGQVSTFLREVPLAQQLEFRAARHMPVEGLKAVAAQFAAWSVESYLLAAAGEGT